MDYTAFVNAASDKVAEFGTLDIFIGLTPLEGLTLSYAGGGLARVPITSPDDMEQSIQVLLSTFSEDVSAALRKRHSAQGWNLRSEATGIDRESGVPRLVCTLTASGSEKVEGEYTGDPAGRKMVVTLLQPVIKALSDGETIYANYHLGDEAEVEFPEYSLKLALGPVTYDQMLNEYMPSLLRFFGNEIRKIDATGDPGVQGALRPMPDDVPAEKQSVHAFELSKVLRDRCRAH